MYYLHYVRHCFQKIHQSRVTVVRHFAVSRKVIKIRSIEIVEWYAVRRGCFQEIDYFIAQYVELSHEQWVPR